VVDALIAAVRDAYRALSHRYYALKARWFGVEQLDYWDRNAPLPEAPTRTDPWARRATRARRLSRVLPRLADVGAQFFDAAGSTPPCGPARRRRLRAPDRAVARIPICCSTTRARRAT
jgi:oligoendopeptidase F